MRNYNKTRGRRKMTKRFKKKNNGNKKQPFTTRTFEMENNTSRISFTISANGVLPPNKNVSPLAPLPGSRNQFITLIVGPGPAVSEGFGWESGAGQRG